MAALLQEFRVVRTILLNSREWVWFRTRLRHGLQRRKGLITKTGIVVSYQVAHKLSHIGTLEHDGDRTGKESNTPWPLVSSETSARRKPTRPEKPIVRSCAKTSTNYTPSRDNRGHLVSSVNTTS